METGGYPLWKLTAGDFNNDGLEDVGFAGDAQGGVLLGNGAGGFALGPNSPNTDNVVAAHTNDDAFLDLATGYSFGGLRVLVSDEGTSFSGAALNQEENWDIVAMAAGRLGSDAYEDLVIVNDQGNVGLFLLAADGSSSIGPMLDIPDAAPSWITDVELIDIDESGREDIIFGAADYGPNTGEVLVCLNSGGAPEFDCSIFYSGPAYPVSIALGDLNGDGRQDVITANRDGTLSVLSGSGGGDLLPHVLVDTPGEPYFVTSGDLNADERDDVVVLAEHADGSWSLHVYFAPLAGFGGGFASQVELPLGWDRPTEVLLADYNSDGGMDVLVGHEPVEHGAIFLSDH